jgi:hypothetical protein
MIIISSLYDSVWTNLLSKKKAIMTQMVMAAVASVKAKT